MKKIYLAPEVMVVKINPQTILAGSGTGDITVTPGESTPSQDSFEADFDEEY